MNFQKLTPIVNKPNAWALSPLVVFLCLYLVASLLINDFYKIPITVAFMVSSIYAVATTKGLSLNDRLLQYSAGAANKNIMLMIWIFILAGAFAQSAQAMGAIDATVNLTLRLLPGNLLLAGIFLASCFISLSIGTSVGTIVAPGSCSCRYRGQDGCQRGFHDGGSSGWCLFRRQPVLHFRYDHRGYPYARVRDARQVPGEFIDCPSGCLAGIRVLCYIWKPY